MARSRIAPRPSALTVTSSGSAAEQSLRLAGHERNEIKIRCAIALADLRLAHLDPKREPIDLVVDQVIALGESERAIQSELVDAGRALLELQKIAGEGGYKALYKAKLVRFNENRASQLRGIASFVDAGGIAPEDLPRATEAAAIVSRLPPESVKSLVREGVISPGTTVAKAKELLRPPPVQRAPRGALTEHERRRMGARLNNLLDIIAKSQREADRIAKVLGLKPGQRYRPKGEAPPDPSEPWDAERKEAERLKGLREKKAWSV